MVQYPAFNAIHVAGRLLALLVNLADELEQRLVHLRQVRHLRGPVVHLQVDVRGVFRVPRRKHLVVPQTLQVGRIHVVRLRRRNQQVASELEVGSHQMVVSSRITARAKPLNALVRGHMGVAILTQRELHAVVVFVVSPLVQLFQRLIAHRHSPLQTLPRLRLLVAGNVLVAPDVGTHGDIERSLVSPHHADGSVRAAHLATLRPHSHTPHEAHLALQPLMLGRNAL